MTEWSGPVRATADEAEQDAAEHNAGCAAQGGFGSAIVVTRDPEAPRRLVIVSGQEIRPDLVEKWDVNEEGNEITLVLRPDVILANGTPFDSLRLLELLKAHADELRKYEYLGGEPVDELTAVVQLGTTAGAEFVRALGEIEVVVLE